MALGLVSRAKLEEANRQLADRRNAVATLTARLAELEANFVEVDRLRSQAVSECTVLKERLAQTEERLRAADAERTRLLDRVIERADKAAEPAQEPQGPRTLSGGEAVYRAMAVRQRRHKEIGR